MANYTAAQVASLRKAIASGVLTVKHGETLTSYKSTKEMIAALRMMEADINGAPPRRTLARFDKGA